MPLRGHGRGGVGSQEGDACAIELFGAEEPDSGEAAGAAGAGRAIFEEEKCNTCHTLAAADAEGKVGPNLDEKLKDKDEAFIRESIVNPDAFVEEGFADNLMPETYGEDLSREELTDLVMFLVQSTRGS